jgi:hypothetical protein
MSVVPLDLTGAQPTVVETEEAFAAAGGSEGFAIKIGGLQRTMRTSLMIYGSAGSIVITGTAVKWICVTTGYCLWLLDPQ